MIALLSLLACSPYAGPVDPWTEAAEACSTSTSDCDDAMARHLGLPDGAHEESAVLAHLLDGMFELLVAEPRPLSALTPEPWLSQEVIDELRYIGDVVGTDHTGQVLYDLVAAQVRQTALRTPESRTVMAFQPGLRELRVDPEKTQWMRGPDFAHALVHEGAHAFAPVHIACSEEDPEDVSCDAGWGGAYAFQVAAAGLLEESCFGDDACQTYAHARDAQQQFILPE